MEALLDLAPVAAFLLAYRFGDIYIATMVLVVAVIVRAAVSWIQHRKISPTLLLTSALVLVLGGLTVWKHDPVYLKWKPTIADWAFAAVMLVTQVRGKTAMEHMFGSQLQKVPHSIWKRANLAFIVFFCASGALNLYVAFNFSEAFWVKFKFIGLTILTLVFGMSLLMWVAKHAAPEESEPS